MSQFTLLFARLVGLLGTESATGVVREFAGQTIQFPVTGHYDPLADVAARAITRGNALRVQAELGRDYNPLPVADAKALTDKLVQESTRQNGKKLLTHTQAAELLRERMAYQPTAEDIAFRDAVLQVAEACNVSLSAAIRLLMAERQRSIAPLSSAGTAPAPDQSGLEGHAGTGVQSEADPNQ